jgi:D-arabinose 1-dehydrogenase-like Zn-dependent alcohol dehydrogenase
MYEGRTDLEAGMVIGHENLGQVIEVGSAVKRIRKGDCVDVHIVSSPVSASRCTRAARSSRPSAASASA